MENLKSFLFLFYLGTILISSILSANSNASALPKNQDSINSILPAKNLPPPPPPDKCKTGQTFKICPPGVNYNPPPPPPPDKCKTGQTFKICPPGVNYNPPPPPPYCPHPEVVCPFPDKFHQ